MSVAGADARPPLSLETVLVVDGEVLVRAPLAAYLRDCGYRVIEASGSRDAIAVLQQPDIAVDVVLSDAGLGAGGDGFNLAHWIRANRPRLELILVGTPERAVAVAGDLCEEGPMLRKPYDHQLVLRRIRSLFAGRKSRGDDDTG